MPVRLSSLPRQVVLQCHTNVVAEIGAAGIVFPHINTPEQAAEAVSKCRYPYSGGTRPRAPAALIAGITDGAPPGLSHEKVADRHIAVICEIESKVRTAAPHYLYPTRPLI